MSYKNGDLVNGFHVSNRAWYGRVVETPRICFGVYQIGDGAPFEGMIEWIELNGTLHPKLTLFSCSWALFDLFKDFFTELAKHDGENTTQDEMIAILKACGFVDLTEYEQKK